MAADGDDGFADITDSQVISDYDGFSTTYEDMALKPEILQGVSNFGLESAPALQRKAVVPMVQGKNVAVQCPPNAGLAIAVAIAALQKVDTQLPQVQVLVLQPTREDCMSSYRLVESLGEVFQPSCMFATGGTQISVDIARLQSDCPHIIVGDVGRVSDLVGRKALDGAELSLCLVADADEILDRGGAAQMAEIMEILPSSAQIVLTASELSPPFETVVSRFLEDDRVSISVEA